MTRRAPDLGEFEALTGVGRRCKTCFIIGTLPPEQKEKLEAALKRRDIGADAVSRVVTNWGHPISDASIRHHRIRCLREEPR